MSINWWVTAVKWLRISGKKSHAHNCQNGAKWYRKFNTVSSFLNEKIWWTGWIMLNQHATTKQLLLPVCVYLYVYMYLCTNMGWKPCVAQLWNWLLDMEESRLTRQIFIWDKLIIGSWSEEMRTLFCYSGFGEAFLINNNKLVQRYMD